MLHRCARLFVAHRKAFSFLLLSFVDHMKAVFSATSSRILFSFVDHLKVFQLLLVDIVFLLVGIRALLNSSCIVGGEQTARFGPSAH